jgi:hypothetical protein
MAADFFRRLLTTVGVGANLLRLFFATAGFLAFLCLFEWLALWHVMPARDVVNTVTLCVSVVLWFLTCGVVVGCILVLWNVRPFLFGPEEFAAGAPTTTSDDPRPLLRDLAARASQIGRARSLPRFVRRRFVAIGDALSKAAEEPGSGLRSLDAAIGPPQSFDFEFRPVAQLGVTTLLFTGIVGTLYGLAAVLSPETIGSVMRSLNEPSEMANSVGRLSGSFGLAFGASLMAYIAYLFGRFLLELADHAHDSLVMFLDSELLSRTRLMLAPYQVDVWVDLPQRTLDLLDGQAKGMQAIANQEEVQVDELRKIATQLAKTASLFNRATKKATVAAKVIGDGLQRGREQWQQASTIWQESTVQFAAEVTTLTGTFGELLASLQTVRESFDRSAAEVDSQIQRMTDIWRDHVREMVQAISNGMTEYRAVISQTAEELRGLIGAFAETRTMVDQGYRGVTQGQNALTAAILHVEQEHQAVGARLVAVLNSRAESLERAALGVTGQIGPLSAELLQMVRAASDLRAAMLGDGRPEDLLGVLRRLNETLLRLSFQ